MHSNTKSELLLTVEEKGSKFQDAGNEVTAKVLSEVCVDKWLWTALHE